MLPLFPLQIVVFPDEEVNLHIFEPRYKQLLQDCEEQGITFGIPAYIEESLMPTGTEIELLEVARRYPNGELDIRTRGLGLFRIEEFYQQHPGKLYAGGEVTRLETDEEGDPELAVQIAEQAAELFQLMGVQVDLPEVPATLRCFSIGHKVGMSVQQEYNLLCQPGERARQRFLLEHFERVIPVVREMERTKEKVRMNGHFRNIKPPRVG